MMNINLIHLISNNNISILILLVEFWQGNFSTDYILFGPNNKIFFFIQQFYSSVFLLIRCYKVYVIYLYFLIIIRSSN